MSFAFTDILISIFDAHPSHQTIEAQSSKYFQPGFDFLINEQKYNDFYNSDNLIKTKSFEFRPLSNRDMETHFWKSYAKIQKGSAWKSMLPIVSKSNKLSLNLDFEIPDVKISIRPVIYLSPIGWSTKIIIRLRGFIKNKELIKLINSVNDKVPEKIPFSVEGETYNIKELFRYCQNLLLEEVYSKDNPPHPGMEIGRHIVISLNKFEGFPVEYDAMTKADQGLMRSILFGKEVDAAMEIAFQGQSNKLKPVEITAPYNFALTDFGYGTLIFLQLDAQKTKKEAAVHCFATNVSNLLMMILSLLSFNKSAVFSEENSPLRVVSSQAKNNLCQLQKAYSNRLNEYYFKNHNSLVDLCPPA